jgi:hypothetical protein
MITYSPPEQMKVLCNPQVLCRVPDTKEFIHQPSAYYPHRLNCIAHSVSLRRRSCRSPRAGGHGLHTPSRCPAGVVAASTFDCPFGGEIHALFPLLGWSQATCPRKRIIPLSDNYSRMANTVPQAFTPHMMTSAPTMVRISRLVRSNIVLSPAGHVALRLSATFRELIALSVRLSLRAISVRSIFYPTMREASHRPQASTVDQLGVGLTSFRFLTPDRNAQSLRRLENRVWLPTSLFSDRFQIHCSGEFDQIAFGSA